MDGEFRVGSFLAPGLVSSSDDESDSQHIVERNNSASSSSRHVVRKNSAASSSQASSSSAFPSTSLAQLANVSLRANSRTDSVTAAQAQPQSIAVQNGAGRLHAGISEHRMKSLYGKGLDLLKRMGYQHGASLGTRDDGIKNPVDHRMRQNKLGLTENEESVFVDEQKYHDPKIYANMTHQKAVSARDPSDSLSRRKAQKRKSSKKTNRMKRIDDADAEIENLRQGGERNFSAFDDGLEDALRSCGEDLESQLEVVLGAMIEAGDVEEAEELEGMFNMHQRLRTCDLGGDDIDPSLQLPPLKRQKSLNVYDGMPYPKTYEKKNKRLFKNARHPTPPPHDSGDELDTVNGS